MESYMIMLYVTIEQEIELKKFFMNRGWPYCKTDLSMMTDHIGPLTGQVPHLTRQTLGLGPSLSPMSVPESQLAQLEASKKRAAEHEAEMPPAKKLVLEPSPVSSPPATAAPPPVTQEPVKVETSAAPVSVGMVPVTPTTGGDAGSQQLQHQGRAGSIPQRLSQEKDIVLDQEPVKVKTEPNTGEIKTYSKVPQRPPVTPAEDKAKKRKTKESDNGPPGPDLVKVARYVVYLKQRGFLISRDMVKQAIIKTIRSPDNHPISSKGPESNKWLDACIESTAELKSCLQDDSETKNSEELKAEYTKCLQESIGRLNQHNITKNIFYCFPTYWKTRENDKIELATALICISLNGNKLPPCIVYEGALPSGSYLDGLPKAKWLHLASEVAEINNEMFSKWFNYSFLGTVTLSQGVLLLMDGSCEMVGLDDYERLTGARKISLVGLPWQKDLAKLTPANWGLTKTLKENMLKIAQRFGYVGKEGSIEKNKFSVVLSYALDQLSTDEMVNAFASAGVCEKKPVKPAMVMKPDGTKAEVANGHKKAK